MWGQIAGAVIGAGASYLGSKKQKEAQDAANAANMASFNQYKPYVDANLEGGSNALDGVLNTGAYTGDTYAGANDFQLNTANTMGNYGTNMMNSGNAMMGNTAGFGNNANSLYGQYQGMANAAQQDRLSNAMDYASANSGSLVDAAMRDDRRNLQENTLTGIDMAAMGSGNMNSSRAGIAEAVANRAYDDRRADVATNIQNSLIDRSLNQQAQQFRDQGSALQGAGQANQSIQSAYGVGLDTLGQGANFGMNAGNALQGFDQAQLNDQRQRFEDQRDFELEQRKGYQAGILGRAPDTSNKFQANMNNPYAAALGGGMAGFGFQQEYFPQAQQGTGSFFRGRTVNPHMR
jgi:ribosome modulation factor